VTDLHATPTPPRAHVAATAWRWLALRLFAAGDGANPFVPLSAVRCGAVRIRHPVEMSFHPVAPTPAARTGVAPGSPPTLELLRGLGMAVLFNSPATASRLERT